MVNFGVQIQQEELEYAEIRKIVQECESLGFDSVWLYDHIYPLSPPLQKSVLDCWVTLAALAVETDTIRLGSLVTCNLFRHPPLLAKMSATLDVISEGRLEFGIGAGWYEDECIAYGIPFPKAGTRINQLREAVQIIKKMWTQNETSFEGKYYNVKNVFCNPKPLQKPHPPIWIGGKGEKLLKVTAEFGNACNLPWCTPEQLKQKIDYIQKCCASLGREPNSLTVSLYFDVLIGKNKKEVTEKLLKFKWEGVPDEKYRSVNIVGTPSECLERIKEYIDAGATYYILSFPEISKLDSLRLFANSVLSALK